MPALQLPGIPESVRQARAMVRAELGVQHPAADTAALIVSELVTNSICYSRSGWPGGKLTVSVEAGPGGLVDLRVDDSGSRTVPAAAEPGPDAEHGYGLRIVAALAASWGTEPVPGGMSTWCRIASGTDHLNPRAAADLAGCHRSPGA